VLAVAGMERDGDVLWNDSITGRPTVVTAPAEQITAAGPDGYWQVQGTSFAAPMVSAVAALVRSRWPTMSAPEVINRIIKTADDRGAPGRDSQYGYGMVDPTAALTAAVPVTEVNPLDTAPPPGVSRFGSAPAAGQTQAAPDNTYSSQSGARASGANAGWAVSPAEPVAPGRSHGWWAAAAFFLLSAGVGVYTVRRFSNLV
jgi:subtilisin family serine protease